MTIAYLCLGSNKGDRVGYIQQATSILSTTEGITVIRTSTMYETEPWHDENVAWFVNAVVEIKTTLDCRALLNACNRIEAQLGRDREKEGHWGDRTIDIDILFFGKEIYDEPDLIVPHKEFHKRAFAIVPMIELNETFVHPVFNKSILELHEELENPEMILLYGTKSDEEF